MAEHPGAQNPWIISQENLSGMQSNRNIYLEHFSDHEKTHCEAKYDLNSANYSYDNVFWMILVNIYYF